jgi:hypothetical protein
MIFYHLLWSAEDDNPNYLGRNNMRCILLLAAVGVMFSSAGCWGSGPPKIREFYADTSSHSTSEPEPPQARTSRSQQFDPFEYDEIAVFVLDHTGQFDSNGGTQRQVEDVFMQAVLKKGFSLAARSDISEVMDELEFQDSGATAEDYAQVGEMLNVSAILIVNINEGDLDYQSNKNISARLIGVRKAEVFWVGSHSVLNGDITDVSRVVARAFPER